jgi:hypothetical protein
VVIWARVQWSVSKPWAPAAVAQRLVDGGKLGIRQARGLSGERVQADGAPAGVPAAEVLAGAAEVAGDLGLGVAGGKQRPGLHADAFEGLAVTQSRGVAAVGGWSHPAMLPGQARQRSPKRAGGRSWSWKKGTCNPAAAR